MGPDDDVVDPSLASLRENRLDRRPLDHQESRLDSAFSQAIRESLEQLVFFSQLIGSMIPDVLRTDLVSDEVGIRRRHVKNRKRGVAGLGQARGELDDVVGQV
jgi:hypothetical protein